MYWSSRYRSLCGIIMSVSTLLCCPRVRRLINTREETSWKRKSSENGRASPAPFVGFVPCSSATCSRHLQIRIVSIRTCCRWPDSWTKQWSFLAGDRAGDTVHFIRTSNKQSFRKKNAWPRILGSECVVKIVGEILDICIVWPCSVVCLKLKVAGKWLWK